MPTSAAAMMVLKDGWDYPDPSANFTSKQPFARKICKWAGIAHWSSKLGIIAE